MANSARGTARKPAAAAFWAEGLQENIDDRDCSGDAKAEIAGYIAQLTAEMSRMAEKAGLDTLAYFLSMARLEAEMNRRSFADST